MNSRNLFALSAGVLVGAFLMSSGAGLNSQAANLMPSVSSPADGNTAWVAVANQVWVCTKSGNCDPKR